MKVVAWNYIMPYVACLGDVHVVVTCKFKFSFMLPSRTSSYDMNSLLLGRVGVLTQKLDYNIVTYLLMFISLVFYHHFSNFQKGASINIKEKKGEKW